MNPKYPANLDPKLREAYDRVMGNGAPQAKTQQQPHQPEAPKEPVKMVTEPAPKQQAGNNDSDVVHYSPDTHTKHKITEEKPEVKVEVKQAPTPTEKKQESKSSATPILLGIIGVLFILGYALFWAQLFGFNVLPSL